jgi:hypothetical protein
MVGGSLLIWILIAALFIYMIVGFLIAARYADTWVAWWLMVWCWPVILIGAGLWWFVDMVITLLRNEKTDK